MLTRQGNDGKFQLLWPDRAEFPLEDNGAFLGRGEDGRLYFSRWFEEPDGSDYREEVVVRRYPAGEVLEVIPGTPVGDARTASSGFSNSICENRTCRSGKPGGTSVVWGCCRK